MKANKIKLTRILRLSVFLLAFALVSCRGSVEKAKEESNEEATEAEATEVSLSKDQFDNSEIKTGFIESKNLNGILKVNGKLDVPPQNLVSISAPIGGFLKSTELLEGLRVKKGQVIAVIEHPEIAQLQEDFVEAKSKYDYLDQELKRQQELNKENVNSAKVLQQI